MLYIAIICLCCVAAHISVTDDDLLKLSISSIEGYLQEFKLTNATQFEMQNIFEMKYQLHSHISNDHLTKVCLQQIADLDSKCHCDMISDNVREKKTAENQSVCCCKNAYIARLFDAVPDRQFDSVKSLYLKSPTDPVITKELFENYTKTTFLIFKDANALVSIENNTFEMLKNLQFLHFDGAINLKSIDEHINFGKNDELRQIMFTGTGLFEAPVLANIQVMNRNRPELILSYNDQLKRVQYDAFRNVHLHALTITNNENLGEITRQFATNSTINTIKVTNNANLHLISEQAFANIAEITELDLSYTSIRFMPRDGLKQVKELKLKQTPQLKELPLLKYFDSLRTVNVHYPYHCCLFKAQQQTMLKTKCIRNKNRIEVTTLNRGMTFGWFKEIEDDSVWNLNDIQDLLDGAFGDSDELHDEDTKFAWLDEEVDDEQLGNHFEGDEMTVCDEIQRVEIDDFLQCYPAPDALNPCEDVMGNWALRVAVWLVCGSAIVGNIGVLFVLSYIRAKQMRVHYFFMSNLAVADLCIAVYLLMLAYKDATTIGVYANSAVDWQTGAGCQVAGFLGVFGTILSVACMTMISCELWYNMRFALRSKFKMTWAILLMLLSWLASLVLAALPMFGLGEYSSTSTCLPIDAETLWEKAFLGLALFTILASVLVIACAYLSLFRHLVRGGATNAKKEDTKVVKKMALLIGTDCVCWAPTVFFGLTAVLGYPLISVSTTKIFLVLFFPINACANPILYVFMTRVIREEVRQIYALHIYPRKHRLQDYLKKRCCAHICCNVPLEKNCQYSDELSTGNDRQRLRNPTGDSDQVSAQQKEARFFYRPASPDSDACVTVSYVKHHLSGESAFTQDTSLPSSPLSRAPMTDFRPSDGSVESRTLLIKRDEDTKLKSYSEWFANTFKIFGDKTFNSQLSNISENSSSMEKDDIKRGSKLAMNKQLRSRSSTSNLLSAKQVQVHAQREAVKKAPRSRFVTVNPTMDNDNMENLSNYCQQLSALTKRMPDVDIEARAYSCEESCLTENNSHLVEALLRECDGDTENEQ